MAKLNARIAPEGLSFRVHEDRYRLYEKVAFRLNDLPILKEEMKRKYKLRFDWEGKYWYIGSEGKTILSQRAIKFAPSISEADLRAKLDGHIDQISNMNLRDTLRATLTTVFSSN